MRRPAFWLLIWGRLMSVFFSFLRVEMENQKQAWTLIIKPNPGWFQLGLGDIWRYRDLVVLFVKRDFVAIYKQTIEILQIYSISPGKPTQSYFQNR